ncbi:hypothetical protein KIPB_004973 [Kipferlia bialata]|uniref:Uncharacterized protein n=1 Tax=Kipferlia bialata TaxID=797122 RepID=A0A9K3GHU1_9EUKA|nr:hypothetical protein KIPB_004973 [Kipferlia bialata]|eukprot:g4973.t1
MLLLWGNAITGGSASCVVETSPSEYNGAPSFILTHTANGIFETTVTGDVDLATVGDYVLYPSYGETVISMVCADVNEIDPRLRELERQGTPSPKGEGKEADLC